MKTFSDSMGSRAVLVCAHVIGLVDLVSLPLWVGTLMQHHGLPPASAGMAVTAFLVAVAASSLVIAPRSQRLRARRWVVGGFALSAGGFMAAAQLPLDAASLGSLLVWHAVSGLGVGCALSLTHGAMGRQPDPHRLWALGSVVLSLFAIAFLGGVPSIVAAHGGQALFMVIAGAMAFAAALSALGFPHNARRTDEIQLRGAALRAAPMPGAVWCIVIVVMCMMLNQSMVFSFVERIGHARDFAASSVQAVLVGIGIVNLLPGALAVVLQKRVSPIAVGFCGPVLQAVLALTLSSALSFLPYAGATVVYVAVLLFTHNFLFGLLARLDASGRAAAGTPAMLMLGACLGPLLGGAVVQTFGYAGIGWAVSGVSAIAVLAMLGLRRASAPADVALGAEGA